jgi:hypothetical protein
MKTNAHVGSSLFALAVLLMHCGRPIADGPEVPFSSALSTTAVGNPAVKTIGPAGGSIASTDGRLVISVPAGAVAVDTEFTVQGVASSAPSGIGSGYKLTPNNVEFAKPLRASFTVSAADLKGLPAESLTPAFQDGDGQWYTNDSLTQKSTGTGSEKQTTAEFDVPLPTLNLPKPPPSKLIENIQVLLEATVTPTSTRVLKGKTARFIVEGVYECDNKPPQGELPRLCLFRRAPNTLTAAAGTLKAINASQFEFTAPDSIPSPNPVGLSFGFDKVGKDKKASLLLLAEAQVTDSDTISGTFKQELNFPALGSTEGYSVLITGTATFEYVDNLSGKGYDKGIGTSISGYTVRSEGKPELQEKTVCETEPVSYKIKIGSDETSHPIALSDDEKTYRIGFFPIALSSSEPKPQTVCTRTSKNSAPQVTTMSTYPTIQFLSGPLPVETPGSFIGSSMRTEDRGPTTAAPMNVSEWSFQK